MNVLVNVNVLVNGVNIMVDREKPQGYKVLIEFYGHCIRY